MSPGPQADARQHPALADAGLVGLDEPPSPVVGVEGQRQGVDLFGREMGRPLRRAHPQLAPDEGIDVAPLAGFHAIQGTAHRRGHVRRNHGRGRAHAAAGDIAFLIHHHSVQLVLDGRHRIGGIGHRRGLAGRHGPRGCIGRPRQGRRALQHARPDPGRQGVHERPEFVPIAGHRRGFGHRRKTRAPLADDDQPQGIARALRAVEMAVQADDRLDVIVIGQEVQEITAAARRRLQCVIAGMIRADQVHRPPLRVALFQGFQQDQMIQAPGRKRHVLERDPPLRTVADPESAQPAERRVGQYVIVRCRGRGLTQDIAGDHRPGPAQQAFQAPRPVGIDLHGGDSCIRRQPEQQRAVTGGRFENGPARADRPQEGAGGHRQR